jgi:hypothetical protein
MKPFIVAEVTKNWSVGQAVKPPLLSNVFEEVIEVNRKRGYSLHSFQVFQLMTSPTTMTETIIAVFRLDQAVPAGSD